MKNLWILVALGFLVIGCNQTTEESPAPVIPEGRLPKAAPAAGEPVVNAPLEPSCVAIITPDVDEGPAPLRVRFTADGMCTDAEGEFRWDFGDGSPGTTGTETEHVYTKPGEYLAQLTLIDTEHGVSDTDEMPISVLEK